MEISDTIKATYDNSFPNCKEGFRKLCEAKELMGNKDFYYAVLNLEKQVNDGSAYKLHPNPKIK